MTETATPAYLDADRARRRPAAAVAVASWVSGFGRLLPRAIGLSGLTIVGQASFLLALPLLSRLFSPSALGLLTLYLSAVNIAGPLVGLKLEAALFGESDRRQRCLCLRLSLTTIGAISLLATALLALLAPWLTGEIGATVRSMLILLPFGMALSGAWNTSTAWAVRENALRTLSVARFLQPFSMAVIQVVMGLLHQPPIGLIVAHVISHLLYSGFIFARTLGRDDVRFMAGCSLRALLARARHDRRFPLYVMPASLMTVLVNNAPPLLMGAMFGTSLAGQYGIAYRVVTGPLTVICMPLANLFTSEVSQGCDALRLRTATRFVLTFSLGLVALPVLLFGLVAPQLCDALLGPPWVVAGQIMTALAAMGAMQAIASPLGDVPSIYHAQEVRLAVDAVQLVLFFLPLAIGYGAGWGALPTIEFMAAGGAVGYGIGVLGALLVLRRVGRRQAPPADPA